MRIKNPQLLKEKREVPCELCNSHNNVAGYHIKTKGSGGHDIEENLISLCFHCHITKLHQWGLNRFCEVYPKMVEILKNKGWYYCEVLKKWRHDEM